MFEPIQSKGIEPLSKQCNDNDYLMVNFICEGLLVLTGTQSENFKLKNLSHSGTRTHDPLIVNPLQLLLGHHI